MHVWIDLKMALVTSNTPKNLNERKRILDRPHYLKYSGGAHVLFWQKHSLINYLFIKVRSVFDRNSHAERISLINCSMQVFFSLLIPYHFLR